MQCWCLLLNPIKCGNLSVACQLLKSVYFFYDIWRVYSWDWIKDGYCFWFFNVHKVIHLLFIFLTLRPLLVVKCLIEKHEQNLLYVHAIFNGIPSDRVIWRWPSIPLWKRTSSCVYITWTYVVLFWGNINCKQLGYVGNVKMWWRIWS